MLGNSINIKVDVISDIRRYWPTVRNRVDMNSGVRSTEYILQNIQGKAALTSVSCSTTSQADVNN